ncbi:DNA polymerase IV [Ileibacterium valens]|uniref:DNA polymerase IV n=2 Tax=Ileibacterium valens TaxID=1862668 RepID=A0A1U7NI51_9FIRM|nr:DNA polymerase IV [Ileibacterium valens]OLU36859.1 DNA polymerase IV [Erysipelotrichaceae bacterium NYU-BL-F16]OLU37557.1 DNA polymerase IV [Erysipelotrichaceae bacterium NYU-BL-E8]OLU41953.1 DNA polymerase IV [Ileibacterium valens]
MARVLFHIDLNAFFASAEELRNPELKEFPIAVGSLSSRGVLTTANYKAREFGVHSAMPVRQALSLCPELKIIPGDYEYYRSLSRQFFDYLRQYSGMLEILSVDECFLDVTEPIKKYARPLDLAVDIQQGVYEKLGLKCSIGVAPTRFLAKMASDMMKPMGITVLRKSEIERKLLPLPVKDMMGIGKKTLPKLQELGIETIGDLANPDNRNKVAPILGKNYWPMMMQIQGKSSDQLSFSSTRKSISHAETFGSDLYSLEEVLNQTRMIAMKLAGRMQKISKMGKQLSVTLRDRDFNNQVRSISLSDYTSRYETLYEAAAILVTENFEPIGYRLIGITVGSLKDEDQINLQPTLFEPASATETIIRQLNNSVKNEGLDAFFMPASELLKKQNKSKADLKNENENSKTKFEASDKDNVETITEKKDYSEDHLK